VKTAGTSYLEALRCVLRHDAKLFTEIVEFARQRYDADKATYHVSATLSKVHPPDDISSLDTVESIYLERWADVPPGRGFTAPGRQILHCTFGSVLTDAKLGSQVKQLLREHPATYAEILREHFVRHLAALQTSR
jgi:hypothetical protein